MNNIAFKLSKHRLGSICKHGHNWNGTGQSLRYISSSSCVTCSELRGLRKRPRRKSVEGYVKRTEEEYPEIDATRFYLGRLCLNNHNWNDSRYSLRRIDNRSCIECANTAKRIKYHKDLENSQKRSRDNVNRYRRSNPEHYKAVRKAYRNANPEKIRHQKYHQEYRKKTNHNVLYTLKELNLHYEQFSGCCVYCGGKATTNDHFLPLRYGGSNTILNLVPACNRCNSSKQDKDPRDWFEAQPFYSKAKWRKILKALGKNDSNYNQIPLL